MKRPPRGPQHVVDRDRPNCQGLSTTSGPDFQTVPSTDLPDVRDIYWRFAGQGRRLPAEPSVILLRGRKADG